MKLPTDEQRKAGFYMGAGAFALLAAFAAFYRPEGAWPLVALAIASAVAANIDKIRGLKASGAGIELEWTMRAEAAVTDMQEIAAKLSTLEAGTQKVLAELEDQTKELAGHIGGGDSYPLVQVVIRGTDGTLVFIVECKGEYPLRGLHLRLVDASVAHPWVAPGTSADLPFVAPRTFAPLTNTTFDDVRLSDYGRLIIFSDALNGVMYQFLDYKKDDGEWHFASCVIAHGRAFKHMDDPNFGPQPDWEGERMRLRRIPLEHEPSGKIL